MKAAVIDNFKGIDAINFKEISLNDPQPHEVQVEIHNAGLNPVDWKVTEGLLKENIEYQFPITLGWDLAGTVTKIGSDIDSFKVGDAVFGYSYKGTLHDGTFTQAINVAASHITYKPKVLSFEEASVIPLSALTAWQALFDIAHLKQGQSILIHAGAGGVGCYALQLAKYVGATTLTTVSESNFDYVQNFGADVVIDYHKHPFHKAVKEYYPEGIDCILESVGYETLKHDYPLIKKGGWLVSITGLLDIELLQEHNINGQWHFVQPNGKQLEHIVQLIDKKKFVPPEIRVISLEDIPDALIESRKGHVKGKISVKI